MQKGNGNIAGNADGHAHYDEQDNGKDDELDAGGAMMLDAFCKRVLGPDHNLERCERLDLHRGPSRSGQALPSQALTSLAGIEVCRNLVHLDLSGHSISALEHRHFAGLRLLEHLDMSRNGITVLDASSLSCMPALRRLLLSGNRIEALPSAIGSLQKLELIDLSGNRLKSLSEINALSSLRRLSVLSCKSNPFTGQSSYRAYTISKLKGLKRLDGKAVTSKQRAGRGDSKGTRAIELQALGEENQRLRTELSAKSEMLERRDTAWMQTKEELSRLQQDVAFFKIDNSSVCSRSAV